MADEPLPQVLETAVQDYFDWADDYMRAVERRNTITTTLYHYTDMGGLQGILTNEEIWFTDYRHLNDPNELMHGIGIAKSLLQQRSKQHGLRPFLFQCIDDLLTKKNFWRVFEFFIASFSRNPDDLGQWRAYADDGRGVAIGFAPDLFLANEPTNKDPAKNMFAGPVLYKDPLTRDRHAKGIDKATWILETAMKYAHRHLKQKQIGIPFIGALARAVIATPIVWNSLTCKHPGYAHESEVRLVIPAVKGKMRGKVLTRLRRGKAVRYVSRKLPLRQKGQIVEIIIGPAAPKTAEARIRTLLKSLGVEARIRRSKIPYRP